MKLTSLPISLRLFISALYILPFILDTYSDNLSGELGWLLYLIIAFLFCYYFGLKGALFHLLLSSLIYLTNELMEYKLNIFDRGDILVVPLVLGINLIFSIGAGLISNKLKHHQHELECANRRLEGRQNEIDEIFNHLDTTIWSIDLKTNKVRMSLGVENITGYTQKDFEDGFFVWTQFVPPEDQKAVRQYFSTIGSENTRGIQHRIITRDGNIKWIESRGKPILDPDNKVIRIIGVIFDITESKNTEEKYRLMAENMSDLVGIVDRDGLFKYLSPSHEKVLGIEVKKYIGTSPFNYIHPDDVEFAHKAFIELMETKTKRTAVFRYIHEKGCFRYIEIHATPVIGTNGEVENAVFVGRDITENIEAEKVLKESWERYKRLQTSLDHFSQDLFGVMKVSELEKRLVKEVKEVLKVNTVCIVEVDLDLHISQSYCMANDKRIQEMLTPYVRTLPACAVIETKDASIIKIGEVKGKHCVLVIDDSRSLLPPEKVWLKTLTRYVNVLYDNFRVIEDLSDELKNIASQQAAPAWLLRLMFNVTESERKRLSQDLHDAALQEQIIWYRKLENLVKDISISDNVRQELLKISEGLLDVIYQIRLTCNELRPPMLKEFGLVSSLESLFEATQLRSDFEIVFNGADFSSSLNDEQLIGLFRIFQELLANAAKHSDADMVYLTLSSKADTVELQYRDNGIGFQRNPEGTYKGMGLYGMKERVRSLEGRIEFESSPDQGLHIFISIPVNNFCEVKA